MNQRNFTGVEFKMRLKEFYPTSEQPTCTSAVGMVQELHGLHYNRWNGISLSPSLFIYTYMHGKIGQRNYLEHDGNSPADVNTINIFSTKNIRSAIDYNSMKYCVKFNVSLVNGLTQKKAIIWTNGDFHRFTGHNDMLLSHT